MRRGGASSFRTSSTSLRPFVRPASAIRASSFSGDAYGPSDTMTSSTSSPRSSSPAPVLPGAVFFHPPNGVELPAELVEPVRELERIYAAQAERQADHRKLLDERAVVADRDRQTLGTALAAGKPEPPPLLADH